MKRYYFDVSGSGWLPDTEGIELESDAVAQREAIRFAGEVMRYEPHHLQDGSLRIDLHDQGDSLRIAIDITLSDQGTRRSS